MCYIVQICPYLNRERNRNSWLIYSLPGFIFKQNNASIFFYQQNSFIRNQYKLSLAHRLQPDFFRIQIKEYNLVFLKKIELIAEETKVVGIGFKLVHFLSNVIV